MWSVGGRTATLLESIVVPIDTNPRIRAGSIDWVSIAVARRRRSAGPDSLAVRAIGFLERVGACARVHRAYESRQEPACGQGSSTAAVLRALNAPTRTAPTAELAAGLPLGADGTAVCSRRTGAHARHQRVLDPWPVEELGPLVVAFSGGGLETKAVYAKYDDLLTMGGFKSTIRGSGQGPLRSQMHNDLEAAAFQLHPTLPVLKKRLVALGAESPAMTGSGAAIFGFWKSWDDAYTAAQQLRVEGVWARVVRVLEEIPTVEVIDDERRDGGRSPSW